MLTDWRYHHGRFNKDYDDPLGSVVGTVNGLGWFIATIEDAPEAEANALLIAAAPDLLEACKALITGRVSGPSSASVHPSGMFCRVCGRNSEVAIHCDGCPVLLAELAIAKAEGPQ